MSQRGPLAPGPRKQLRLAEKRERRQARAAAHAERLLLAMDQPAADWSTPAPRMWVGADYASSLPRAGDDAHTKEKRQQRAAAFGRPWR